MQEKLFAYQKDLGDETYKKAAKEIGLDVKKFEQDLKNNDKKYEQQIEEDMQLGIKEAKVRGTPSIYVAGWELRYERTADGVKKLMKEKGLL